MKRRIAPAFSPRVPSAPPHDHPYSRPPCRASTTSPSKPPPPNSRPRGDRLSSPLHSKRLNAGHPKKVDIMAPHCAFRISPHPHQPTAMAARCRCFADQVTDRLVPRSRRDRLQSSRLGLDSPGSIWRIAATLISDLTDSFSRPSQRYVKETSAAPPLISSMELATPYHPAYSQPKMLAIVRLILGEKKSHVK